VVACSRLSQRQRGRHGRRWSCAMTVERGDGNDVIAGGSMFPISQRQRGRHGRRWSCATTVERGDGNDVIAGGSMFQISQRQRGKHDHRWSCATTVEHATMLLMKITGVHATQYRQPIVAHRRGSVVRGTMQLQCANSADEFCIRAGEVNTARKLI